MIKLPEGVERLAEVGDVTSKRIESIENQLAKIQSNSITFAKNFLSIDTQALPHGLVTVSSKVNESPGPISITKLTQTAIRSKFSTA